MKIQKANPILMEYPKAFRGGRVVISSAVLCLVFLMSCSLIGEAQPSPTATADQFTATVFSPPSLTFTIEPSPSESPTSIPTLTRTRRPTATPTTIFDACAELTGMTAGEIRDFFYRIKDYVANNKRRELAGMVFFPIGVYFGEKKVTISNADQLVANYDQIINQRVRDAVLNQKEEDFHCNYQGVGLTHGEIWFGGICDDQTCERYTIYITAINNYRGAW